MGRKIRLLGSYFFVIGVSVGVIVVIFGFVIPDRSMNPPDKVPNSIKSSDIESNVENDLNSSISREFRTWKSNRGSRIIGKLLTANDEQVFIEKQDNKKILSVLIRQLSQEDKDYIGRYLDQMAPFFKDSVNQHPRYWICGDNPQKVIYGNLIKIHDDSIELQLADGSSKNIPLIELSEADKHYLNVLQENPELQRLEHLRSDFRHGSFSPRCNLTISEDSELPDLDVLFISRTPGSPTLHRLVDYADGIPQLNEEGKSIRNYYVDENAPVTFTAHIANYGKKISNPFDVQWKIDGRNVGSRIHCKKLKPEERCEVEFSWNWQNGSHTVTVELDPDNQIEETVEINNLRTDSIQASGFVVGVTEEFFHALRQHANMIGSFSPEDWIQWHMDQMNQKFAESIYPTSPKGCLFRTRIDHIFVAKDRDECNQKLLQFKDISQGNWSIDGNYQDIWNHPDWGLIHEWGHQLGLIDYYQLDHWQDRTHLQDEYGNRLVIEHPFGNFNVMMHNHGANPFSDLDAAALNHQITPQGQQTPRGFYGDYLFTLCNQYAVRILDRNHHPIPNVTIDLFQRSSENGQIEAPSTFTVKTDANGVVTLPNVPVKHIETVGGFHTTDNPFGKINVVGQNGLFLLRVEQNHRYSWSWLDITEFCIPAYAGETEHTFDISTTFSSLTNLPIAQNIQLTDHDGLRITFESSPHASVKAYRVYLRQERSAEAELLVTLPALSEKNYTSEPLDDFMNTPVDREQNKYLTIYAVDERGNEGNASETFCVPTTVGAHGICVTPDGTIFISDQHPHTGRVVALYEGRMGKPWSYEKDDENIGRILGIAVDVAHSGKDPYRLVAVNEFGHKVIFIGPNGEKRGCFGRKGSNTGEFLEPDSVAMDRDGNLYISDKGNHRIQVFSPTGEFQQEFGNDKISRPRGIVVDNQKRVYVADEDKNVVLVFDEKGRFVQKLGENVLERPNALALCDDILVVSRGADLILYSTKTGKQIKSISTPVKDGMQGLTVFERKIIGIGMGDGVRYFSIGIDDILK